MNKSVTLEWHAPFILDIFFLKSIFRSRSATGGTSFACSFQKCNKADGKMVVYVRVTTWLRLKKHCGHCWSKTSSSTGRKQEANTGPQCQRQRFCGSITPSHYFLFYSWWTRIIIPWATTGLCFFNRHWFRFFENKCSFSWEGWLTNTEKKKLGQCLSLWAKTNSVKMSKLNLSFFSSTFYWTGFNLNVLCHH